MARALSEKVSSDFCHGSGAPWPTREVLMPSSFAAMILGLLAMIKCSINSWEHRQWKSCSGSMNIAWSGESQQGVVFSCSNSMSCGNLNTSSREDNASVLENSPNRDENSMRAADVAVLYNFVALYMEFGPNELVEQNTWNMALNMASSFLLSVVIFMLHAIRIGCVTFEALYSWCLPVSVMSAFVAMYMNVVTIGFLGMLVVSSQHALTNLGSLNPSAYHSLWLFSIVIVSIWSHLNGLAKSRKSIGKNAREGVTVHAEDS